MSKKVAAAARETAAALPFPADWPRSGRVNPRRSWIPDLRRVGWPVETVYVPAYSLETPGNTCVRALPATGDIGVFEPLGTEVTVGDRTFRADTPRGVVADALDEAGRGHEARLLHAGLPVTRPVGSAALRRSSASDQPITAVPEAWLRDLADRLGVDWSYACRREIADAPA